MVVQIRKPENEGIFFQEQWKKKKKKKKKKNAGKEQGEDWNKICWKEVENE